MAANSFLFVPGDQPDKLAKARRRGADAVIVDLEDAVLPTRRGDAIEIVAGWLADQDPADGGEIWVRVSSVEAAAEQCARLPRDALTGIVVPKVRRAAGLGALTPLDVPVIAFVETAPAVLDMEAIAATPSVVRLVLGEADLGADLGIAPVGADELFLPIRVQSVVVSAASGLAPPLGPVDPDFSDLDRYRETTRLLRRIGFGGRTCIHPAQVAVVNAVFTPTPDEEARARDVVSRFEAAAATGTGVVVADDGTMVDEAYVRWARRVLAEAEAARRRATGP